MSRFFGEDLLKVISQFNLVLLEEITHDELILSHKEWKIALLIRCAINQHHDRLSDVNQRIKGGGKIIRKKAKCSQWLMVLITHVQDEQTDENMWSTKMKKINRR